MTDDGHGFDHAHEPSGTVWGIHGMCEQAALPGAGRAMDEQDVESEREVRQALYRSACREGFSADYST